MLPEYLRSYLCTLTAIDIIRYQNLFSFIYTQMIIYSEYEINSFSIGSKINMTEIYLYVNTEQGQTYDE